MNGIRKLTPRQLEICEYLSRGWCDKDIAAAMGLSPQTVKNQLAMAYDRTDAENRTQLAIMYIRYRPAGETLERGAA